MWRLSSRGAWRVLLGAAWVAGWVGLCAWVVWFAHTQAANPRDDAMRGWCHTRVRYLYQRLLSSVARVQEMSALVKVLNGYGPRSATNLTYWGLAGCANNESLARYNDATLSIARLTTGSLVMLVQDADRPLVESITGMRIVSLLGLPSPRKPLYIINVLGSVDPAQPLAPFTDFSAIVPPDILATFLQGSPASSPPVFIGKQRVSTVFVVPILRHPVPAGATAEQLRESISTMWAGLYFLEIKLKELLALLQNGTSPYSLALYDTTDPGQPIQVVGPEPLRLENRAIYPFVLPGPVVPTPKHVEPFPEALLGRSYEAHCRFEGAYPTWDLVYAPMLLGLLVLIVAVLLSAVIAVLAWKRTQMAEGVREIQLCTAALETAVRSKSETVANTSHELRTPIIGMIGMIEELLESALEEWQRADLRDARACAEETVDLINRVLDLAKLQAGRLQLETLPCCLRRIAHKAIALVACDAQIKELQVTCHVDEGVPGVLMGDPTRLAQVIGELTAHAKSNTMAGHVTFHVCCIPPPPPPPASINCFNLHGASTTAPPSHASHDFNASPPSPAPPASSAWQQLAACVRRFPPPTRLACLPQRLPASHGSRAGAGAAIRLGGEKGLIGLMGCVKHSCRRVAAAAGMSDEREERGEQGEEAQAGHGRLEKEVREWVEGACRAREEGEWMVVMACEDTGGGIPPEEMQWVLDPHGDSHHSSAVDGGGGDASDGCDGGDGDSQGVKGGFFPLSLITRSSPLALASASTARMTHEQRAAARPRWTPYPVRFLLSTALVAEMRGGMSVLSDATTGATVLVALPMGGGWSLQARGLRTRVRRAMWRGVRWKGMA
ncbi:hypothetical protein CLOM_g863 [Closterium sp. NIES-68]|nr:hypothetical protein CLOM_g863 [Closterium sp. NIES-68]